MHFYLPAILAVDVQVFVKGCEATAETSGHRTTYAPYTLYGDHAKWGNARSVEKRRGAGWYCTVGGPNQTGPLVARICGENYCFLSFFSSFPTVSSYTYWTFVEARLVQ